MSRWEGSDGLSITFEDQADLHEVRITQPLFDRFSIERIQPGPDRNLVIQGAQSLTFPAQGPVPH